MSNDIFSREVSKRLRSITGPVEGFPRHKLHEASGNKPKVVLVAAGSFSPISFLHLRLFEQLKDNLIRHGYDVLGGYISPVNDAYKKKGLVHAKHRVKMCELATDSSDWIMVDSWESEQSEYLTTILILEHFYNNLNRDLKEGEQPIQVKLLCGGDLVESFNTPGVWAKEDMKEILEKFGLAVLERVGSNLADIIYNNDLLYEYEKQIFIARQTIPNEISSTKIRQCILRGLSIKYLTPDPVVDYIRANNLYQITYNS